MEQEVPVDASSLIYLAKADVFDLVGRIVRPILVSPSVWREAVIAGQEVGAPEVPRIVRAEGDGLVTHAPLEESERHLAGTIATQYRLGEGESEVLAIAPPGGRAIVDEGRATRVARSRGVTPISTLFLAVVGYEARDLELDEATDVLRRIAAAIGVRSDVTLALERELQRRRT